MSNFLKRKRRKIYYLDYQRITFFSSYNPSYTSQYFTDIANEAANPTVYEYREDLRNDIGIGAKIKKSVIQKVNNNIQFQDELTNTGNYTSINLDEFIEENMNFNNATDFMLFTKNVGQYQQDIATNNLKKTRLQLKQMIIRDNLLNYNFDELKNIYDNPDMAKYVPKKGILAKIARGFVHVGRGLKKFGKAIQNTYNWLVDDDNQAKIVTGVYGAAIALSYLTPAAVPFAANAGRLWLGYAVANPGMQRLIKKMTGGAYNMFADTFNYAYEMAYGADHVVYDAQGNPHTIHVDSTLGDIYHDITDQWYDSNFYRTMSNNPYYRNTMQGIRDLRNHGVDLAYQYAQYPNRIGNFMGQQYSNARNAIVNRYNQNRQAFMNDIGNTAGYVWDGTKYVLGNTANLGYQGIKGAANLGWEGVKGTANLGYKGVKGAAKLTGNFLYDQYMQQIAQGKQNEKEFYKNSKQALIASKKLANQGLVGFKKLAKNVGSYIKDNTRVGEIYGNLQNALQEDDLMSVINDQMDRYVYDPTREAVVTAGKNFKRNFDNTVIKAKDDIDFINKKAKQYRDKFNNQYKTPALNNLDMILNRVGGIGPFLYRVAADDIDSADPQNKKYYYERYTGKKDFSKRHTTDYDYMNLYEEGKIATSGLKKFWDKLTKHTNKDYDAHGFLKPSKDKIKIMKAQKYDKMYRKYLEDLNDNDIKKALNDLDQKKKLENINTDL